MRTFSFVLLALTACSSPADDAGRKKPPRPAALQPVPRGAVSWRQWPPEWHGDKVVMVFFHSRRSFWSRDVALRCFGDTHLAAETARLTQPIWVDVDDRPDLAARYGLGAWPSIAFLTPEGDWVTGTTYIEPDDYGRLLRRAALFFEIPERREDLERNRRNLLSRLNPRSSPLPIQPSRNLVDRILDRVVAAADSGRPLSPETFLALVRERGGIGSSVPFPGTALAVPGRGESTEGDLLDAELHLGVVASRIRALALAGLASGQADWVEAARTSADEILARLSTDSALLASGEAAFLSPDTGNVHILRYTGRGPIDSRTLTAWNARAASAFAALGTASGRPEYSNRARRIIRALLEDRVDDMGRVQRLAAPTGVYFFEDAAFLARACLDTDGFLDDARGIVDRALQLFEEEDVVLRDRWPDDGEPVSTTVDRELASPIGVMAEVLVDLALRTGHRPYVLAARKVVVRHGGAGLDRAHRSGAITGALAQWLDAADRLSVIE